jgi:hypothetical protein
VLHEGRIAQLRNLQRGQPVQVAEVEQLASLDDVVISEGRHLGGPVLL